MGNRNIQLEKRRGRKKEKGLFRIFKVLKRIKIQNTQNVWDAANTVLRGKFIALKYLHKERGKLSSQ